MQLSVFKQKLYIDFLNTSSILRNQHFAEVSSIDANRLLFHSTRWKTQLYFENQLYNLHNSLLIFVPFFVCVNDNKQAAFSIDFGILFKG